MAYRALYREWRPKDFSHVVGQNAIIDTLRNQVVAKRIAHAYLFCGSRGTGKTSTAKILAKAINSYILCII
jgi:DNA polymerase-3 subunit gamma/tau